MTAKNRRPQVSARGFKKDGAVQAKKKVDWIEGQMRTIDGVPCRTWFADVPVDLTTPIEHNPAERTDRNSNKYKTKEFVDSVESTGGPLESITLAGTPDMDSWVTGNGNSRRAVAKELQRKSKKEVLIHAVLIDCDPERLFAILNAKAASRRINPSDKPRLFLVAPAMLDAEEVKIQQSAFNVLGEDTYRWFASSRKSIFFYNQAVRLSSLCGYEKNKDGESPFIACCLRWLIAHNASANAVEQGIRNETVKADIIRDAVLKNTAIHDFATKKQQRAAKLVVAVEVE